MFSWQKPVSAEPAPDTLGVNSALTNLGSVLEVTCQVLGISPRWTSPTLGLLHDQSQPLHLLGQDSLIVPLL